MSTRPATPARLVAWVLPVLVAALLVVDAVIHLDLAGRYQQAAPGGIGEGTLFRLEAAAALLAALYVLARPAARSFTVALVISAAGVAAVLVYRYVDVPAVGPWPAMYEPVWFPEKNWSAIAEGAAAILAVVALLLPASLTSPRLHRPRTPARHTRTSR